MRRADLGRSLQSCRRGACGIAPAVSINGKVYPKVEVTQVPEIIKSYREEAAS